jgi:hypothetical protein
MRWRGETALKRTRSSTGFAAAHVPRLLVLQHQHTTTDNTALTNPLSEDQCLVRQSDTGATGVPLGFFIHASPSCSALSWSIYVKLPRPSDRTIPRLTDKVPITSFLYRSSRTSSGDKANTLVGHYTRYWRGSSSLFEISKKMRWGFQ